MIRLIPYFECNFFLIILHSYYNCYFKVTFSLVKTITILIEVSKFVPFKKIESFRIKNNDRTMRTHIINPYCYYIIIYYVCALHGIRFIISSIWSIIVRNSEVRAVVCF